METKPEKKEMIFSAGSENTAENTGIKKSGKTAKKKKLTITPLFDEEGNLVEEVETGSQASMDMPDRVDVEKDKSTDIADIGIQEIENEPLVEDGAIPEADPETEELTEEIVAVPGTELKEEGPGDENVVIPEADPETEELSEEIVAVPSTELKEEGPGDENVVIPEAEPETEELSEEIVAVPGTELKEEGPGDENVVIPEAEPETEELSEEIVAVPGTELKEEGPGDEIVAIPEADPETEKLRDEESGNDDLGSPPIETKVETGSEVQNEIITKPESVATIETDQATTEVIAKEAGPDDAESESTEDDDIDEVEDHADYTSLNKEEIVTAMEELVLLENVMAYRQKAGKLKIAFNAFHKAEKESLLEEFISGGGKHEDFIMPEDKLTERFEAALTIYKDKKQQHLERLEEIKRENLEKKLQMLEQIKDLINSEEPLKKTYDEFRSIQDKWREIGNVPRNEISNLWQNYHFLVEKFFDKVKINNELRDLDMKKNLEKKIELCEKAEELLLESSVLKSFKQLQRYHQEWKEIGAVPHDKKDELWERFKATTEKINERRREYYEELHGEQENNLSAKRALCEKMDEILTAMPETISHWQKANDEVNELVKMWRTLGPAPRQHNDTIWNRFKSLIDDFYNQKKNHFSSVKNEQINNYNLKLDICQQAEALKDSTSWRDTTEELIRLQQEWKKIGPVPRRYADKIWKRFRSACDEFFNKKQSFFSNQKVSEEENLKVKESLIEKIRQIKIGEKREETLNDLKEIQREFINTGHVPIRKKNEVNAAFREAINQKLDQLKISPREISVTQFRGRIGDGHTGKDYSGHASAKEQTFLSGKINKLKNDIALWENNIGFLANSAAADVLKREFEKKIERTKDEVALLETKLKMLME